MDNGRWPEPGEFWGRRRVCVTGGAGFLGSFVVEAIARLTGFAGDIRWDTSKPNGQPRRRLDTSRAERLFGFRAHTPFEAGLRRTIGWHEASLSRLSPSPAMLELQKT
jgi:nucleoside-diphosphate-sugar epimerase